MKAVSKPRGHRQEDVYYGDDSVWVTSRRLVFDGWEESLRGVNGARVHVVQGKDRLRDVVLYTLLALVMILLVWFNISYPNPGSSLVANIVGGSLVLLLLGALVMKVVRRTKRSATTYLVSVGYRFWRYVAAASTDPAYAEQIVTAIEYAMARRDNRADKVTAPSGVGFASSISAPRIKDNIIYAGEAEYNLSEVRSVDVSIMTGIYWTNVVALGFTALIQLTMVVQKYFSNLYGVIQPLVIGVGIVGTIALVATVFLIPASIRGSRVVHTVELKLGTGSKVVIFASTDKRNAEQVRDSIKEEMQDAGHSNQTVKQE